MQVDLSLEIIGERNEKVDELEADIADMKAIFREQLEVAVEQLAEARASLAAAVSEKQQQDESHAAVSGADKERSDGGCSKI